MNHKILSLCCSLLPLIATATPTTRKSFNDGWLFIKADSTQFSSPKYSASHWRNIELPHDWSREYHASPTLASCTGYLPGGVGWYRKNFEISELKPGEHIKLYFEGIYNRSEVYVNGELVGSRPNGYISMEYDITPWLQEGSNTIAVRVDHSREADSRWYTGSGIYRNVWIYSRPEYHIANWGVSYDARIKKNKGQVAVTVELDGDMSKPTDMIMILRDMDGQEVGRKKIKAKNERNIKATLSINNPQTWDIDAPYLYSLETNLLRDNQIIDSETIPVGFRELSFHPQSGFKLNGRSLKIKGVCLHHDGGAVGAAVPDIILRHRLKTLKSLGVNAIRCSHNPQSPAFYNLCDSLGLMVMDEGSDEWEFPKRKWVEGWNVGTPSFEGTSDFFEKWIERDITDMVKRDRVHPSVIMWSVGNEVDYPNDPYSHPVLDGGSNGFTQPMFGGYNPDAPNAERIGHIAERLAKCIRNVDSTRPVTGALAGVMMSNCTSYPEAVDLVGYNYTESRYKEDHETYPDRIIYGSENSSDYDAWCAVRDNEFISGQFIWTGADYLGESREWPSRGLGTGLIDFSNEIKPRGYFRASLWSDKPMAYLGTYKLNQYNSNPDDISIDASHNWNYIPDDTIRVVCYTNAPSARLILNDSLVGSPKEIISSQGLVYWDIPYTEGTIRVEAAYADGKIVEDSISTVSYPTVMEAEVIERDVTHALVKLTAFDSDNNICHLADDEITCITEGCKLLALENGSNTDMSDYFSNTRRLHRGTLVAIIQLDKNCNQQNVVFKNPLLKAVEVKL
ncbi:MAG: DUF4982 domain-containing protein [Muribaculaceae bacterium]|nr:DUF4982 domain-containing protein [Muribaculaceae bacterium]